MNFKKNLKKSIAGLLAAAAIVLVPGVAFAITPGSIPYEGAETSGVNFPAFNIFNNVPGVGNEADFIRVKKDGEANSTLRNTVDTTCKTGDRFDIWFYLHNGAKPSANNNGTGPGVAHNVVAKVTLPQGEQTSFNITGGVTASNAEAISDGAVINCGGKQFKLKYVEGSASAFLDLPNTNVSLPSSIVGSGAAIGTNALNGDVWGCWEQRVWMGLKVEVEEITPPPATAQCEMLTITASDNRKVIVDQFKTAQSGGAAFKSVTINWGDNTAATVINNADQVKGVSHQYAQDGNYTITAVATFSNPGGADITSGGAGTPCIQQVSFTGKPPVVVTPAGGPTKLVNAGAGDVAVLFALATLGGVIGYRWYLGRKLAQ